MGGVGNRLDKNRLSASLNEFSMSCLVRTTQSSISLMEFLLCKAMTQYLTTDISRWDRMTDKVWIAPSQVPPMVRTVHGWSLKTWKTENPSRRFSTRWALASEVGNRHRQSESGSHHRTSSLISTAAASFFDHNNRNKI